MSESFQLLVREARDRWNAVNSSGPWIRIGAAICGVAAGARDVAEAFASDMKHKGVEGTISMVGCLGLCYAEPLVDIQIPGGPRVVYGRVTPEIVSELVEACLLNSNAKHELALGVLGKDPVEGIPYLSELPMMRGQVRIALRNSGHIDPGDIYQYIANGGYAGLDKALFGMTSQQVVDEVLASGLRGRGGAAFPTGTKWSFLTRSPGPVKYILCNCEEGDPGAFNDKAILEGDPHTVIEGLALAGYATEASKGFVFIRHGHDGPIERTRMAIDQAYELGLLGENILGSGFSFDVEIALTGDSYVSGEETALMESIEGRRAMPRSRPPFPAQVGLWGKPSNINNVKTLAYVPEIISRGSKWFAGIGTEKSKGTAILCLTGNITRPGIIEVPMGLTLRQALEEMAGGIPDGKTLKLLQTGGPLGGVLPSEKVDTVLDFDAMAQAGAILGSGGIIVASDDVCAVDLTRVLVAFCQFESCGKCFPCRLGTTHLLEIMERICRCETRPGDLELVQSIGSSMAAGSLCGHGQLGFNPIRSAITFFAADFESHIKERRCPTGSCDEVMFNPSRTRR
jgi:NADH-quinone oxidoreductase subunit F